MFNRTISSKKAKENELINKRQQEDQKEYIEYLEIQNEQQQGEIRQLKEEKIDLEDKMLSTDLELKKKDSSLKAKDEEIRLLTERIKYLEDLVGNYRNMPDLKNMIDNLSEITSPSIEKLAEVLKNSNFDNIAKVEDKIDKLSSMVNEIYHYTPRPRMYNL